MNLLEDQDMQEFLQISRLGFWKIEVREGNIISSFYYPDPDTVKKLSDLRKNDGIVDYEFVINKGKKLEFVRNVSRFEIILCHKIAEEKTILEDIKMKVEVATDGEVALKCIKRVPADYYDLVLMDIQMPRMNGYQATEVIRNLSDERADIPIVAMTANAFEEDRKAAFDAGMNGHVANPIEIGKLMKTLAGILR